MKIYLNRLVQSQVMKRNNILRGSIIIGVLLALLIGVGFNYFYVYDYLKDVDMAWFVAMLMYSIVMFLQQLYIVNNETVYHKNNDLYVRLAWGPLCLFAVNILAVCTGFTFFHRDLIWVALVLLGSPLLLYMARYLFLK